MTSIYKYDIFISYSHADKPFAVALERDLSRYRTPLFSSMRPRRFNIFRDETEAAGTNLTNEIRTALQGSRLLIVLCSNASSKSRWVNKEIRLFHEQDASRSIVPVLIDTPVKNEQIMSDKGTFQFPPALQGKKTDELWATDFREVENLNKKLNKHRSSWFHLLASIFGTTRSDIEQRETKRRLQNAGFFLAFLIVIGVTGQSVLKLTAQNKAREIAAESQALNDNQSYHKLQTARKALSIHDISEARDAARAAISTHLKYLKSAYWYGGNDSVVSADADFRRILIVSPFGGARVWDMSSGEMSDACGHHGMLKNPRLSPDGKTAVWFDEQERSLDFWKLDKQIMHKETPSFRFWSSGRFEFSNDSRHLITLPFSKPHQLWSLDTGKKVRTFENSTSADEKLGEESVFSDDSQSILQYPESTISYSNIAAIRDTDSGEILKTFGVGKPPDSIGFTKNSDRVIWSFSGGFGVIDLSKETRTAVNFNSLEFDYSLLSALPHDFFKDQTVARSQYEEVIPERIPSFTEELDIIYILMAENSDVAVMIGSANFAIDPYSVGFISNFQIIDGYVNDFVLSPDGKYLGAGRDQLRLWSVETGKLLWSHDGSYDQIAFSEDGTVLVGTIHHGLKDSRVVPGAKIDVFDVATAEVVSQLFPHEDDLPQQGREEAKLWLLHVSSDGNRIVARSHHSIYEWNLSASSITRLEGTFRQEDATYQAALALDYENATVKDLVTTAYRFSRDCRDVQK